jgi:hypothetical protein
LHWTLQLPPAHVSVITLLLFAVTVQPPFGQEKLHAPFPSHSNAHPGPEQVSLHGAFDTQAAHVPLQLTLAGSTPPLELLFEGAPEEPEDEGVPDAGPLGALPDVPPDVPPLPPGAPDDDPGSGVGLGDELTVQAATSSDVTIRASPVSDRFFMMSSCEES